MTREIVLETRTLAKAYRQGEVVVPVLRGIDFAVAAGEFVAILGPSGSGKSTLLNMLGLMDAPSSGEVLIGGRAAGPLSEEERCRLRNEKLGFVFQFDSLLPEFTVLENVTMPGRIALAARGGRLPDLEDSARRGLERLGLGPLTGRFPRQLSGGERQRAAIARALLNAPAAILADEPTGNLDRSNGELVFSTLREQAETRGVAVVMVTHNEEAARFASRSVHLLDGRVQVAGVQP
ncbi:MAG: ABC transporter ATP-binding protein [Elusimicrobia bacterium]|nr:ABC transporter ATP-binding protein [Elusimicrobiota bacterium]